jgi:hypothetical protein
MSRLSPRAYGVGQGWVVASSGQRLSKSACAAALARHVAISNDMNARPRDVENAKACANQLTEAMRLSFTDSQEALL